MELVWEMRFRGRQYQRVKEVISRVLGDCLSFFVRFYSKFDMGDVVVLNV